MMPRTTPLLPIAIRRELKQLGSDIQRGRRRRRLTAAMVAERAQISRPTLRRVEHGDASVGLGVYATVLWVLGLGDRIGRLAAPETDLIGLSMEDERLPQRVSAGRRRPRTQQAATERPAVSDTTDVSGPTSDEAPRRE
jgi:transcriptional regulator with XRE-family HTH domain